MIQSITRKWRRLIFRHRSFEKSFQLFLCLIWRRGNSSKEETATQGQISLCTARRQRNSNWIKASEGKMKMKLVNEVRKRKSMFRWWRRRLGENFTKKLMSLLGIRWEFLNSFRMRTLRIVRSLIDKFSSENIWRRNNCSQIRKSLLRKPIRIYSTTSIIRFIKSLLRWSMNKVSNK